MNNQVPVKLYDPEKQTLYTIYLDESDAQLCETDLEFTQQLLAHAMSEESKKDQTDTEASSMIDPETTDVHSHIGENEEKSGWSYNETLALIAAYDNYKENFQIAKKRKFVWQDIANQLLSNGFERSAAKCESKWRNLIRTYKNVKDLKRSTGRGVVKYQFFSQIDDILGDKPGISCPHTFSTTVTPVTDTGLCTGKPSTSTNEEHIQLSSNDHDFESSNTSNTDNISSVSEIKSSDVDTKKGTKRKITSDEILKKKHEELIDIKINYFKKKQEESEARHVKRDRKLEIKEKMLELEQKKIDLLEKQFRKSKRNLT